MRLQLRKLRNYRVLYLFLCPSLIITLIWAYLPMAGNIVAFMNYKITDGPLGLNSPWVWFSNFDFVLKPWFWRLFARTLLYGLTSLYTIMPASILLALLLNELRNPLFRKITQTVSYVPHFVSWVTVSGLFYLFLTIDATGLINNIRAFFGFTERISFMQRDGAFLPVLIVSHLWKETGWNSIVFVASIAAIDPKLYEAAKIDGAGRFAQALYITLPSLLPTISIILILNMAGVLTSNFDQIFNLHNDVIRRMTHTIDTFVYWRGIRAFQYSFGAAVALFRGLIVFMLTMLTNYISRRANDIAII